MSLETTLDKDDVNSSHGQSNFTRYRHAHLALEFGYDLYHDADDKGAIVTPSGRVVFGGWHNCLYYIDQIDGTLFLTAKHIRYGSAGVYSEDGTFFPTLLDAGFAPFSETVSSFGLRESLYKVCNKTLGMIKGFREEQVELLKNVVSDINERIVQNKGDPVRLKNSLKQFILGLEYLAKHPDEALDYVQGGLGR